VVPHDRNLEDTVSVTHNFHNFNSIHSCVAELYEEGGADLVETFSERLRRQIPTSKTALELALVPFRSGCDSVPEYVATFQNAAIFEPMLEAVARANRLSLNDEYQALTKRINPTFLKVEENVIIKLYSCLAGLELDDTSGPLLHAESKVGGDISQKVEEHVLHALQRALPVPSRRYIPTLIGAGRVFGVGHEAPWHWPYVVMTRMRGGTLQDVYSNRKSKSGVHRFQVQATCRRLAQSLGSLVREIHGCARDKSLRLELFSLGRGCFAKWLELLRPRSIGSHVRRGYLPLHLVRELDAYLDQHMPLVHSRAIHQVALLHGDLQFENVIITTQPSPRDQAAAFLERVWNTKVDSRLRRLAHRLLDEELLGLESLALMSDGQLEAAGIPVGPRVLLRKALEGRGNSAPGPPPPPALRGVIDFADGRLGDPLYDLVALYVGAFRCDPRQLRAFLDGYERAPGSPLAPRLATTQAIAMCLTILHPCDALSKAFAYQPALASCPNWAAVARALWRPLATEPPTNRPAPSRHHV